MEASLGMRPTDFNGYGYNLLLTAFYIPCESHRDYSLIRGRPVSAGADIPGPLLDVLFEIPCNFLCKISGPGKFLPAAALGFGLFSMLMAFANNFGAAFAFRFMLGLAEAGFFPGVGLALSRWYTKAELGFRFACFLVAVPLAGSFGGLLASGFLSTPGFGSVRGWRVIFFAEGACDVYLAPQNPSADADLDTSFGTGLITMGLAVILYFMLPDSPATAWFLTPEERGKLAHAVFIS